MIADKVLPQKSSACELDATTNQADLVDSSSANDSDEGLNTNNLPLQFCSPGIEYLMLIAEDFFSSRDRNIIFAFFTYFLRLKPEISLSILVQNTCLNHIFLSLQVMKG